MEIDTTGGPGFGFEHYKAYDFLRLKEVVLTFDDGPQVGYTHAVLEALAAHCTKATFFSIGKMAAGLPEIIRDVAKAGHTIGTHTWSHADLSKLKNEDDWKAEIEKGVSAVRRAVGGPIAPFFRYPVLKDTKELLTHLASRNIAIFSADLDSFDFKFTPDPEGFVKSVMEQAGEEGQGHPALPRRPARHREGGAAGAGRAEGQGLQGRAHAAQGRGQDAGASTMPQIEPLMKGMAAGNARPMSSVVRTIEEAHAGDREGHRVDQEVAADVHTHGERAHWPEAMQCVAATMAHRMTRPRKAGVDEVLRFWFEETRPKQWFEKDEAFDAEVRAALPRRCTRPWPRSRARRCSSDARTALAAVIVLDQMPRNMFRGSPRAFATDAKALGIADAVIARGFDAGLTKDERLFCYLPFEHAEDSAAQVRCVALMSALGDADLTKWAEAHKAIIDRFGRFPHRNAVLGRPSTPDEIEFLEAAGQLVLNVR